MKGDIMGLDVGFNKAEALAAGMVLEKETNGTLEEIQGALELGDLEHAEWLSREETITAVPNASHKVCVYESGDMLFIRANKWGRTYEPLTSWLKEHNIGWVEC